MGELPVAKCFVGSDAVTRISPFLVNPRSEMKNFTLRLGIAHPTQLNQHLHGVLGATQKMYCTISQARVRLSK